MVPMKPEATKQGSAGSWAGFLFLALIPLMAVSLAAPLAWLTQDLVLRWSSALLLLFCFGPFLFSPKKQLSVDLDFLNLTVLLLAAWVLFSVKNSKEAFESFYAFRNFAVLTSLWFSLRILWDRQPGLYACFERVFFWTSAAAALWLCATTLGHHSTLSFFQKFVPRKGFFVNENSAAGFLGMALIWAVLKKNHHGPMPLWAIGLFFLGSTLTQSRGAFVALLIVAVLYLLLHMKEVENRLKGWKKGEWILFGSVVVVFLVCSSFTVHKLFNPLEVDTRASNRWDLWTSGFKMALDQPLLGFGPGTFPDAYSFYKPASIWNTFVVAAHNEFLQVAVECGWPALFLVLLFLWEILRKSGRDLFRADVFKKIPWDLQVSETVFFLVLFEAVHNSVDFTFHEWSHRLVLLGFVTYAVRGNKPPEELRATIHLSRFAFLAGAWFFAAVVFWMMGVGGFRDYLAQIYDLRGKMAYQQNNLDEAESFARRSLELRRDLTNSWNLLGVAADVRGERASVPLERKKYFQAAEEYYGKAVQLSPYALQPLENKVHFLVVQRRLSEALELQNLLVDRAPQNPVEYIQRAQILLAMGRAQDSILSAQKAVDLDDYFIPGYVAKAQAMEALGKRADAIQIDRSIEEIIKKQNIPDLDRRLGEVEANIQRLQSKR